MQQQLPVGLENFAEIRKKHFYYVDKTGLISDLLRHWSQVHLITRPRRFGKSLNLSMLHAFFEIGTDPALFDGLAVRQDKEVWDTCMGQYPVLHLSLKDAGGLTFEDACQRMGDVIRGEALRLKCVLEDPITDESEKRKLLRILNEEETKHDLAAALKLFCALLERHYHQKVILLIDEYDVPLAKAYQHGYYEQMADLIRNMFSTALKTNDSLSFAVLTGCLRLSRESIFTGLNNMKVHGITDPLLDAYFGFTQAEVQQMMTAYRLKDHLTDVSDWYDGYRFGVREIYCPWDVINYCYDLLASAEAEPKSYWINTSGNDLIRRLIQRTVDATIQLETEQLLAGKLIWKQINENLTYDEVDVNIENLWSVLYMTGYLTLAGKPENGLYPLRIPNLEIRQIFTRQILAWLSQKTVSEAGKLTRHYQAFEQADADAIADFLNARLLENVSYYDAQESFYHGFLLALLGTCPEWLVSSNREAGKGRSDILVCRRDRKLGFAIEIKATRDEEKLDAACETALLQIVAKDYTAQLRQESVKEVTMFGIAFCGKKCRVMAQTQDKHDTALS